MQTSTATIASRSTAWIFVHQAAHVDREAGREQQRRQEQGQEQFGADLELVEADEGVAQARRA